jgi:L-lactate utilization protein LutB
MQSDAYSTYVALVSDMTGRCARVCGTAISWSSFVDQLKEVGCEVIENQSMNYKAVDELTLNDMNEYGVIAIQELTTHADLP